TRSAANTNNQSRTRNPTLVSCTTSSGTCCVSSRLLASNLRCPPPPGCRRSHRSLARPPLCGTRVGSPCRTPKNGRSALGAEHQRRVADPDDVAVGELPGLHRGAVHRGAVGGTDVRQRRALAVPGDLEVTTRDTGVGKPEVGILASADHVAALLERVGPVRTVVELQDGCELTVPGRRHAATRVAALLLSVRVATTGRGRRSLGGVTTGRARRSRITLVIAGLAVALVIAAGLPVTLVVTRLPIALVIAAGLPVTLVVARLPIALVIATGLPVTLVVT